MELIMTLQHTNFSSVNPLYDHITEKVGNVINNLEEELERMLACCSFRRANAVNIALGKKLQSQCLD